MKLAERIKILDEKIMDEKIIYDLNREKKFPLGLVFETRKRKN